MLKRLIIFAPFLIAPLWSFSQDSLATVRISDLRKAAELILEGDRCRDNEEVLLSLIENKDVQIEHLTEVRHIQDSILSNANLIASNKDSIIIAKDLFIDDQNKKVRKVKIISGGLGLLLILSLLL